MQTKIKGMFFSLHFIFFFPPSQIPIETLRYQNLNPEISGEDEWSYELFHKT